MCLVCSDITHRECYACFGLVLTLHIIEHTLCAVLPFSTLSAAAHLFCLVVSYFLCCVILCVV